MLERLESITKFLASRICDAEIYYGGKGVTHSFHKDPSGNRSN